MNVNNLTFDGHGRLNVPECLACGTFEFDSKLDIRRHWDRSEGTGTTSFRKGIELLRMHRLAVQANGMLEFLRLAGDATNFNGRRDTPVGRVASLKSPGRLSSLIRDGDGRITNVRTSMKGRT